jgi:hypothetical protein
MSKEGESMVEASNPSESCSCQRNAEETPLTNPRHETSRFIYAIGTIQPRFPNIAIEKEYFQAIGGIDDTSGKTNQQTMIEVLSRPENRYLARQLCWVFSVRSVDTYILYPRDPSDIDSMINSLRSSPRPTDVDVLVGLRGPMSSPQLCNGLVVPTVMYDLVYSFDTDSLIKRIANNFTDEIRAKTDTKKSKEPDKKIQDQITKGAEELFYYVVQISENIGASDKHRALNYLIVRYPALYTLVTEMNKRESSLTGLQVLASPLSSTRKVMDAILSFTNRRTDVLEKYYVPVDVTDEFPFLVAKVAPYYDRMV